MILVAVCDRNNKIIVIEEQIDSLVISVESHSRSRRRKNTNPIKKCPIAALNVADRLSSYSNLESFSIAPLCSVS